MSFQIVVGDCRETLKMLPDESVHCVVTSPPYFGLRSYIEVPPVAWGGDPSCAHAWGEEIEGAFDGRSFEGKVEGTDGVFERKKARLNGVGALKAGQTCARCGAWLGHWGLEPTFERWLANSVEVFREVRRVLRSDGTFWLNVGQSYATSPRGNKAGDHSTSSLTSPGRQDGIQRVQSKPDFGSFKMKDLIMQGPFLAEALRRDGWYLRQTCVWAKRNCLPERAHDRPAVAHEYVFLLAKSARYFYDDAAVRVPYAEKTKPQKGTKYKGQNTKERKDGSQNASDAKRRIIESMERRGGRNLRTVWEDDEKLVTLLRSAISVRSNDLLSSMIGSLLARDPVLEVLTRDGFEGVDDLWERAGEALALLEGRVAVGDSSVWWVNPQANPSAHTAAFPEALVTPCIKAGTSEKGACPLCGAPWWRQVDVSYQSHGVIAETDKDREGLRLRNETGEQHVGTKFSNRKHGRATKEVATVGWEPGCECRKPDGQPYEPRPCVVLDPCGGSGTVGVVSERLGRDSILLELSPLYAAQAEARISDPEWATKERRRLRAERAANHAAEAGDVEEVRQTMEEQES
jgi:DNA modification methylase